MASWACFQDMVMLRLIPDHERISSAWRLFSKHYSHSSHERVWSGLRPGLRISMTSDLLPLSPLSLISAFLLCCQNLIRPLACCLRPHGMGFVLGWHWRRGGNALSSCRCHIWGTMHAHPICRCALELDSISIRVSDPDGLGFLGRPRPEVVAAG